MSARYMTWQKSQIGSALMGKGSEVGMADTYRKAWESIGNALSTQSKMILWIAERTLSAKEYKEFVDEFTKKPEGDRDELLDFILKEGR